MPTVEVIQNLPTTHPIVFAVMVGIVIILALNEAVAFIDSRYASFADNMRATKHLRAPKG